MANAAALELLTAAARGDDPGALAALERLRVALVPDVRAGIEIASKLLATDEGDAKAAG